VRQKFRFAVMDDRTPGKSVRFPGSGDAYRAADDGSFRRVGAGRLNGSQKRAQRRLAEAAAKLGPEAVGRIVAEEVAKAAAPEKQ